MEKNELVSIRDAVIGDKNFILATFLRGLYYGDSWYGEIPKSVFMSEYHKFLELLLSHPTTKVKIACLKDDTDVILGYVIMNTSETVLHFAFCKKAWRGIGITRQLVPTTVTSVTHLTKVGLSIIKKKGLVFNPFLT